MTLEAWLTLATLAGVLTVLATDRFSPALTLLVGVIFLLVTGVVPPAEAFSGFSNPAPITVAALFILAAAAEKTGMLQPVVKWVLGRSGGRRRSLARVVAPTVGASAILNNTPIVAMFSPQISQWAERHGVSPSRFLMPLSFASILGGMITLIGTSTNLVVSGLLEASGQEPLGMFELTPIGLPVALVGMTLIVLLAPVVLPDRRGPIQQDVAQLREFVVNMDVVDGGPLDGRTVAEAGLRHLTGLFLVEIRRGDEVLAPVSGRTLLRGGDRLMLVGRAEDVVELQKIRGLVSAERDQLDFFEDADHTFFAAVVGEGSPLVGGTLKEAEFRGRYQAAVVAIHRSGQRVADKLGRVPLKVGDTLILLTDSRFGQRWRDRHDFLLVSRLGGAAPSMTRKAPLVAGVALTVIAAAAAGLMPILSAALVGVVALLALRVLTPTEARNAINFEVIVVIASALGLAAASQSSGLSDQIAAILVGGLGDLGPIAALAGILFSTVAMTVLITNTASAALIFPIAMSTAQGVGVEPRVFAVALAVVASGSFLTPIGYQTNTMVYGPGGYRFSDYSRLGAPLILTVVATVLFLTWLRL